jgi:hypothetical protein
MSDERIRARLAEAGYDRQTVTGENRRSKLMEMLVLCVVKREEQEKANPCSLRTSATLKILYNNNNNRSGTRRTLKGAVRNIKIGDRMKQTRD